MASRRQPHTPQIESRQLTRAEIDRGIARLRKRIDEVKAWDPQKIFYSDAQKSIAEANIRDTICEIFGQQSPECMRHRGHEIYRGPQVLIDAMPAELQQYFMAGIPDTIAMLEGLVSRLEEKRDDVPTDGPTSIPARPSVSTSRSVFLVHGHDEAAAQAVARFLEKLELAPIILHEKANQGRTIIEKFEKNADVPFAVVLVTPDDVGACAPATNPDELRPRARQNVIFELGYFIGRLGRERVCALNKGGVEIPSDFHGVVSVPMDSAQGWRILLAREIKAAGIGVDLNKAI